MNYNKYNKYNIYFPTTLLRAISLKMKDGWYHEITKLYYKV